MAVQACPVPADLADKDEYVGYTVIAKRLSAQHPERTRPFSRQLVHRWFLRRAYNDFPAPHMVTMDNGKVKKLFLWKAVEEWHRTYRAHHQQKTIETIPLFQVDSAGKLVA